MNTSIIECDNNKLKICFIGDANVGKSNIISRLVHNIYINDIPSTIGVEFSMVYKNINNTQYKIQLWDTAGQERFNSIVKLYYKHSHGIILVYDIANKNSFNNIDRWYKNIKNICSDEKIKIMLVGNKLDLNEHRQVTYNEGLKYAEKNNLLFLEVSAYCDINNNMSNINNMLNIITEKIVINNDMCCDVNIKKNSKTEFKLENNIKINNCCNK